MPKNANELKSDIEALRELRDEDIDTSDCPELDETFFASAVRVEPPKVKEKITIRLDADILDWFRAQGPGYQTKINGILRAYKQHTEAEAQ